MQADPNVEPAVDWFSCVLPLPFRTAIIFVSCIWFWGAGIQGLQYKGIDLLALIKYHSRASTTTTSHHRRTYRFAIIQTVPLVISIFFFWFVTRGQPNLVQAWDFVPQLELVVLFLLFFAPLPRTSPTGRSRLRSTLKRISIGNIAENQNGRFGDLLAADALTSLAKPLGDLFISQCMFFSPGISATAVPDRGCGGAYLVPLLLAYPYMVRLIQCMVEYKRVRDSVRDSPKLAAQLGWGGQHLANALKYASAFPVIVLSSLQRGASDPNDIGLTETSLYGVWFFCVLLNSSFSFWWDVVKDWDLTMFSSYQERNNPEHPWGLRSRIQFHNSNLYYGAIIGDLMLRFTWSLKLSPHLYHFSDVEGGVFTMELLEIFRRWIWLFFRVEAEWVRSIRGPPPEDILLVDYDGRLEDGYVE